MQRFLNFFHQHFNRKDLEALASVLVEELLYEHPEANHLTLMGLARAEVWGIYPNSRRRRRRLLAAVRAELLDYFRQWQPIERI